MKKIEQKLLLTFGIIGILLFISIQPVNCQNIIAGDPSDTFDLQAVFVNPAVIPFHHRQVLFGMRLYQVGFLNNSQFGLRSSYLSFTLPQVFLGMFDVGFTGQNFSTQLYDQTNFSFQIAKQTFDRVFIGAKYNLFTKSYHREYFDLENDNDPVFADGTAKFAHSFGAGVVIFPWSHLALSFSCDHLNQPDVSLLKENYRQPLMLDFGCRYSYGHFSSSLYFNNQQDFWQMNWILESRPTPTTTFKIGYVQNAAKFETQLYLFNGFSMNYMFDYPFYEVNQFSRGSHQISCIIQLDHKEKLKELQFTEYNKGKSPIFNLSAQISAAMDCENLEILTQKIIHSVDQSIPDGALAYLTDIDLSLSDSTINLAGFRSHGNMNKGEPGALYGSPKYSQKYQDYLDHIAKKSVRSVENQVELITDPNSFHRATDLRSSLVARHPDLDKKIQIKTLDFETKGDGISKRSANSATMNDAVVVNPKIVHFNISSIKIRKNNLPWELIITDHSGKIIKSFSGRGDVPPTLSWDWKDANGNLLKPNIYFYYFQWNEKNQKAIQSPHKSFYVNKISRTVSVDLRFAPDLQQDAGSTVEIKFSN